MPTRLRLPAAWGRTEPAPASALPRRTLFAETGWVLALSLGASAIWSVLSLIRKLTYAGGLAGQTTAMNTSVVPDRPWLDLVYQLVGIVLALAPVGLALHLLARDGITRRWLGLDARAPWRDLAWGAGLAALIGIPGLGLYLAARALGLNTTIAAAGLEDVWWAVPVLILAAVKNALLEEGLMIGYLLTRWEQAGWSPRRCVVVSAIVRGAYHLYQGFGGFVGNVAMGLILGAAYRARRRVLPLVVTHTLLDVVAFVGYAGLHGRVGWL